MKVEINAIKNIVDENNKNDGSNSNNVNEKLLLENIEKYKKEIDYLKTIIKKLYNTKNIINKDDDNDSKKSSENKNYDFVGFNNSSNIDDNKK
jgi:hypothetical protein